MRNRTRTHRIASLVALGLAMILGACAPRVRLPSQAAAGGDAHPLLTTPAAPSPSPLPSGAVIDLTAPPSQEPQTDAEVFDESAIFAPNFAVNQNDKALSDLFGSGGVSNLCFPTALAEALIDLYAYHAPQFDALKLAGLSSDLKSIDADALVRSLAAACKTDPNEGTLGVDGLRCVLSLLSESGYGAGDTHLVSPFDKDPSLPLINREVTVQDIRTALASGNPVLLEITWYQFNAQTRAWTRHGGHYVGLYGYDYDRAWGEDEIQVKVINPETQYGPSREFALWDTVTIQRYSPQPGITYPPNRPLILSGSGFGGLKLRGFVGMMMAVAPSGR